MSNDQDSAIDDCRYYSLEDYLFSEVHRRFHRDRSIGAFDLFSIVIWKANRAKSIVARKLLKQHADLEMAARDFTSALFRAEIDEMRLLEAMEKWKLRLPMASAILSVLWPDEFTVFDVRVCGELRDFAWLVNRSAKATWSSYTAYREAVIQAVPELTSLREKDRCLWGRSVKRQLRADIDKRFEKGA